MRKINVVSYKPSRDEEYMNPTQLAYFKSKLLILRHEIIEENKKLKAYLKETDINVPDPVDQGATQSGFEKDCFDMARQFRKLCKIDNALELMQDGEYGYCEVSGEEIGLKRLEILPTATMSVEVQEMREQYVKHSELGDVSVCFSE